MRLGVITAYKVGFNEHGIQILNIFPEGVRWSNPLNRYQYFPTQYYIKYDKGRGCGPEMWFAEGYQINTLIHKAMLIEKGVTCLNSAFQDETLIRMVVERRQRRGKPTNKTSKVKSLPVWVTLRKRDIKTEKTRKPSCIQGIKRQDLHHPTITIPFPPSQLPIYLDMMTYNTMKYAYIKKMRKLGLDPTLVDDAIQARLNKGFKGSANKWLKQFAA
jgi:hypothetical protein